MADKSDLRPSWGEVLWRGIVDHGHHRRSRCGCSLALAGFHDRLVPRCVAGGFRGRRRQRRRLAGAGVPRRPALGPHASASGRSSSTSCSCFAARPVAGHRHRRLLDRVGDRDRARDHHHHVDRRCWRHRRRRLARPTPVPAGAPPRPRTPTSPMCPASCSSNSTVSPTRCCVGHCARRRRSDPAPLDRDGSHRLSVGRRAGRRRPASASAGSCTARRRTCRRSAGSTRRPATSSCRTTRSGRPHRAGRTPTATDCSPTTGRATATCSPATPSGPC